MKQITITIPDNCELKQDDNTYIIVEKEKKLTYDYVANKLFPNGKIHFNIDNGGCINTIVSRTYNYTCKYNANSKKQLEKLLAINMLMNVAKYLNGDWQPDWNKCAEYKYYIYIFGEQLKVSSRSRTHVETVYFKSEEFAQKAIEILGEETIKLALCTDY